MAATNQVALGPKGPSPLGASPGRRRLSRSSGALPFGFLPAGAVRKPTLGVVRRHADQVCVVGARKERLAAGRSRERDWHTGKVGARARPEGKIVSVTIAGPADDLLFRTTASWKAGFAPAAARQLPAEAGGFERSRVSPGQTGA